MEALFKDISYGIRMLMKRPSLNAIAIIALALGIGANTAIFSVVNGVLLRPLPYKDSNQLYLVSEKSPRGGRNTVSDGNFIDWRDQNQVFDMAAITGESFNLSGDKEPEQVAGMKSSANLFDILAIKASLGRT